MYADDTNAFYSDKNLKSLTNIMQEEMNKVTNWLNVNKLSINTTKTKYIIFKSSNKKCDTEINIQLNHNTIQQVTHVKFLGVIIDQNLTWKNHINSVLKNIIKATALIAKLRHFTNRNTLKLIYYALVYPFLTYGNLTWGNTYPTRLQKLLNVQKKFIRLITFKSYLEHTEPLFHKLKILNIFKINDYLSCLLISCTVLNTSKIYLNFLIITSRGIVKYIVIILEMQTNFTLTIEEPIMPNIPLLTRELKYGIPLMKRLAILGLILLLK